MCQSIPAGPAGMRLPVSELTPSGICMCEVICRGHFVFETESEEGLVQWSCRVRQRILGEWVRRHGEWGTLPGLMVCFQVPKETFGRLS